MKTFAKISVVLLFVLISSCSKSDSSPTPQPTIEGLWGLKYVNGSFTGASYYFEPGVITWTFNPSNNTVTIENNNTDNNLNDVLPSGVYSYEIIPSTDPSICSQMIKINGIEMGCLTIQTNDLIINQNFVDGMSIQLVRYLL